MKNIPKDLVVGRFKLDSYFISENEFNINGHSMKVMEIKNGSKTLPGPFSIARAFEEGKEIVVSIKDKSNNCFEFTIKLDKDWINIQKNNR